VDDVYRAALTAVLEDGRRRPSSTNPSSPHSRFGAGGGALIEAHAVVLRTDEPARVGLTSRTRNARLFRSLGMAVWNLRGASDVASMALYNDAARVFSDDGEGLRAPWGVRLLGPPGLVEAVRALEADPGSLRTVAPVFTADDIGVHSRDVPCLLSLIFNLRDGVLHATAVFRALNAFAVFPHDHCLVACLVEAVRAHLGVERSALTYFVESLHIREDDAERARAVLAEPPGEGAALTFRPSPLTEALAELAALEPPLRAAFAAGDPETVPLAGSTWAVDLLTLLRDEWRRG
jgi:thymidylate synthase